MPRYFSFENIKNVSGMCCKGIVSGALKDYENILNIEMNSCVYQFANMPKTMTIAISDNNTLSDEDIENELKIILSDFLSEEDETKKRDNYHGSQALLGILSGATMMLLMFLDVSLSASVHTGLIYFGSITTLIIGFPSFYKVFLDLKRKHKSIHMDWLFSISGLTAAVLGLMHLLLDPRIPMLIDASLMIFGFRHFGLLLQESIIPKTQRKIKFVDRGRESSFYIMNSDKEFDIYRPSSEKPHEKLNQVPMGAILKIPKGEYIPLNGVVIDSEGEISFTLSTGTLDTKLKKPGDMLYAGMMVCSEAITMRVNALEMDSYLRARDIAVITAMSKKAPIQDSTSMMLSWFIPGVIFFSMMCLVSSYWIGPVGINAALYFMVCACPCALALVTPMAINIGLGKSTDAGFKFNTAKGLQAAGEIDTVIFDLNGTLTKNKPRVIHGGCTIDKKFFSVIRAMEEKSSSHIAKAVLAHIKSRPLGKVILEKIEPSHNGVTAKFYDNIYQIGNEDFIKPSFEKRVTDTKGAQHVIYFKKNGVVQGHFLVEDPLRDDAPWVVQSLIANEIKVKVHTGASRETANRYMKPLGLDPSCVESNCVATREEGDRNKYALMKAIQEQGHVVGMFGDSGNDVEAIGGADLGGAMNSPAMDPMILQTADVSINTELLYPAVEILALGRQSMRHIKQNLAVSFGYNALSMVFVGCAIFLMPSLLNPAFGAALMVFQTGCILLNAWRINVQAATLPVKIPYVRAFPLLSSDAEQEARFASVIRYSSGNKINLENILKPLYENLDFSPVRTKDKCSPQHL